MILNPPSWLRVVSYSKFIRLLVYWIMYAKIVYVFCSISSLLSRVWDVVNILICLWGKWVEYKYVHEWICELHGKESKVHFDLHSWTIYVDWMYWRLVKYDFMLVMNSTEANFIRIPSRPSQSLGWWTMPILYDCFLLNLN